MNHEKTNHSLLPDHAGDAGLSQTNAELERRALQGNTEAQVALGERYERGREGALQDYLEAVKWYRAAAEQGLPLAQYLLGYMYEIGRGVPQDYVQAHTWYNLYSAGGAKDGSTMRDDLAENMTGEQLAEAQRLATAWKPKTWEVIRKELKIE